MKKIIFIIAIITLIWSCTKEKEVQIEQTDNSYCKAVTPPILQTIYTLDGVVVPNLDLNDSTRTYVVIETNPAVINAFTSDANERSWALTQGERGATHIEQLNMAIEMYNYANTTGAIGIYESTGVMPQFMLDYIAAKTNIPIDGPGDFYKQENGAGPNFPALTYGSLPNSWNNEISSVKFLSGTSTYFDKTFWRSRMVSFWHYPTNYYRSFAGCWYNNKTSSTLCNVVN